MNILFQKFFIRVIYPNGSVKFPGPIIFFILFYFIFFYFIKKNGAAGYGVNTI